MKDRVLIFTSSHYLSIQHEQLQAIDRETGKINQESLDNVGFIILESSRITLTQAVLVHAAQQNIAIITCDKKHLPLSLTLPYQSNCMSTKMIRYQTKNSLALHKALWKKIVVQKIENQYLLLKSIYPLSSKLNRLSILIKKVRSGDPNNIEGQAAKNYFQPLFGIKFRRIAQHGDYINNCLDYGYSIIRSATARMLVSAGLTPQIAIQHKNQYSAYPLADDMIEPYRPFVDRLVFTMQEKKDQQKDVKLSINDRQKLNKVLFIRCKTEKGNSNLLNAIKLSASSLAKAFLEKNASKLITHAI